MEIADFYDALISKRVYNPPMSHTKAVGIIVTRRGKRFDPGMVNAFVEIHDESRAIVQAFADVDEEREVLSR
jgi:putative two-component system response regulator